MDVREAVSKFKNGILNEIFHSSADSELQDSLVKAVNEVEKTVIEIYEAEQKSKKR